jgi:UDP-hydrolysing UDP-N-acetyl-D-glucosamine 2-epimerase
MGEDPRRVFFSGSLCLDDLRRSKLLTTAELEKKLSLRFDDQKLLVVHHPVTLMRDTIEESQELFAALRQMPQPIVFVYPNADAGSRELIARTEKFIRSRSNARLFVNLDHLTYLTLMASVDVLLGNSSSGLIESTSLGVPALNIGIRQSGREHAANVIDVPSDRSRILSAVRKALSPKFRRTVRGLKNPYGDGRASQIITRVLATTGLGEALLFKA